MKNKGFSLAVAAIILILLRSLAFGADSVTTTVNTSPGASGSWTNTISPAHRNESQSLNVSIVGTSFIGAVTLQRSFDGTNFYDVARWCGDFQGSLTDAEAGAAYRIGVANGDYVSGSVALRLSKGGGSIPERPTFNTVSVWGGDTACASGSALTSSTLNLSPYDGTFGVFVKIDGSGTAALEYEESVDGTNFTEPDSNGDGTYDDADIFTGMTSSGGANSDGLYYRQVQMDAAKEARFILTGSGGSPVTPTVTLIAR